MNTKAGFLSLPLKFWIVTLIAFINSVSFTIIIPILYPFAKQFGLSDFQASLLTTAYAASQFIGTPVLGRLSDRLGRKPLLILSLLGTVLANVTASLATVAWLVYCARVVDGLTGGNTSIARAVISDTTDLEQRPKAFGIFGAVFRLGFVAGPALSYLAQQLPPVPGVSSLGMGFLLSAGFAAIAILLCLFALPETHVQCDPVFRLHWSDFGFGRLARSITDKKFGRLFLLTFLSGATFTIFTFAFQPFFLNVLGQNAKTLAIAFAIVGMLGFIAQVLGLEPLRRRFDLVHILAGALLLRGVIFLLMPTFPLLPVFWVLLAIFGAINSFPMPLVDTLLSLRSSQKQQGEVLGLNASYLSIANAIGPATGGLLVSLSYRAPFWITGVLTILTAGFALTLRREFDEP